eukprot:CAMPEP_0183357920 /NCGR_PEP_ID=MMETSP0164_2-20130417/47722_1 /TAXON_ID=221442 /ORGANISM="Coccolithus pelagicus ssp braarudi, Strain PLY182g" /LENGTH=47 /DNA_ID= /DNA_START= /DNA_END= /DNA_ORIENTATION=
MGVPRSLASRQQLAACAIHVPHQTHAPTANAQAYRLKLPAQHVRAAH